MINANYTNLQTPLRTIKGKVELLGSSTSFTHTDALKSFKVERLGESGKFFGFGVSQKLTVVLLDKNRVINLDSGTALMPRLTADEEYVNECCFCTGFRVKASETSRDEKTNELTIVAYDTIAEASLYTFSELNLVPPYSISDVARAAANKLDLSCSLPSGINDLVYEDGANFEGTETLREVFDAIAEATQTIYYVYHNDLVFKRLSNETVLTIDKSQYFDLTSGELQVLASVCHATELGDNVEAVSADVSGVTQYVRDNPFWEMREDIGTVVESALAAVEGTTIQQFSCSWRGNFYLEIGDRIAIVGKDNSLINSYVLNDTIEYNGALKQSTNWEYTKNEETESNPSSLGDAIKQTYARVDKANKQIELVASESDANKSAIAALQINTDSISSIVSNLEAVTKEALENNSDEIANLKQSVEAQMTPEKVSLQIREELDNGVSKVETSTGFTFNEEGLTVNKTNSEMKTTITEDGMTVYKNDEAVLTADNTGVNAKNLHATTYLIIGNNSRFEDYGGRTGCFWIGGNS